MMTPIDNWSPEYFSDDEEMQLLDSPQDLFSDSEVNNTKMVNNQVLPISPCFMLCEPIAVDQEEYDDDVFTDDEPEVNANDNFQIVKELQGGNHPNEKKFGLSDKEFNSAAETRAKKALPDMDLADAMAVVDRRNEARIAKKREPEFFYDHQRLIMEEFERENPAEDWDVMEEAMEEDESWSPAGFGVGEI